VFERRSFLEEQNLKTLKGSPRARKGKIRAKDDLSKDQYEQGLLTSYFNQPAARALARLRASPQARARWLSGLDGSPWSCAGGVPVTFLFVVLHL